MVFLKLGFCASFSERYKLEKEQSTEPPPSVMTSLPDDVIIDILARIPRCDYPILSLVSKHFRSLVSWPEIYVRRSLLGCTEHCLYFVLCDRDNYDNRLYILRRKAKGNSRLVLIPSLPALPRGGSYVAVGSRIYVFGGVNKDRTTSAVTIDCRSHTAQPLPSIPMPMYNTVADIIDGRIYLIGNSDCGDDPKKVMVVFNTETQTSEEPATIKADIELRDTYYHGCVMMADKLYMRDDDNSFVYAPEENKWETDEMLNLMKWNNACVDDQVLYFFDCGENNLRRYDPKKRCWGVVNGEWFGRVVG
ncbi:unnamed protein product [Thlaspi arvense]|uniref:F-box domain-containing protein n=1 Tax=Thlaspi arvense TaxID=13288 RepID=A0AAU9S540_THLAR|nr:unnamed protein product [Thlaspi arvense]